MGEEQKKIFDYTPKPILSLFFLDNRYNLHNLPYKIKKTIIIQKFPLSTKDKRN